MKTQISSPNLAAVSDRVQRVTANLSRAFPHLAEDLAHRVLAETQRRIPHRSGTTAATGEVRGATVTFGGARAPWYPWLEFGGSVGRGHRRGKPWSGSVKRDWLGAPGGSGRYLFPALAAVKAECLAEAADALGGAAHDAGFEVQ